MGKRFLKSGVLLLLMSAGAVQQASAAQCEYSVVNDWGAGFQAEISITNDGTSAINSWAVSWEYTDGSSINHGWNATISSANPYSATALSWNANIAPGNSVAFGFVGSNGNSQAQIPVISGDVCAVAGSSSSTQSSSSIASPSSASVASSSSVINSSSTVSSSSVVSSSSLAVSSSSVINSSSSVAESSSSISTGDSWQLDSTLSQLTFSTTKKLHVVENMTFTELSGGISEGIATLDIALASVDSGIDVRSERMRNFLFETSIFPSATVTLPVDSVDLEALAVGETTTLSVVASLSLHGVSNDITTDLKVSRLSIGQIMVQNVAPILVVADAYDLEGGIEELRTIASLNSIGKVVPVDFTLFFSAQ